MKNESATLTVGKPIRFHMAGPVAAPAQQWQPAEPSIPGGRYPWSRNTDGTYNVHDVPIMAELAKGDKGATDDIGRDWMQSAMEFAQYKLTREKFLPPLHVRHNKDSGPAPTPAGVFLPNRVGTMMLDGAEKATLFADLRSIPEHVFNMLQRGELLYRSVEIPPWNTLERPEIASLALLDTRAPFFKLENLTLGEEIKDPGLPQTFAEHSGRPVVAEYRTTAGRSMILFDFGGPDMTLKVKPDVKLEDDAAGDKDEKPDRSKMAALFAGLMEGMKKLAGYFGGDDEDEDKTKGTTAEETVKPAGTTSATPVEQSGAPKAAAYEKEFIVMEGRMAGLEKKLSDREATEKRASMLEGAVKSLAGWPINDKIKARLSNVCLEGGQKALDEAVALYREQVPKELPRTMEELDARGGGAAMESDAPELVVFAREGADTLEKARKFSRQYDKLVGKVQVTRERFIRQQIAFESGTGLFVPFGQQPNVTGTRN